MLAGDVVIVTGGTKGIGKAITHAFLDWLTIVIVVYATDQKAMDSLFSGLSTEQQARCIPFQCDISDLDQVRAFSHFVQSKFKSVRFLVNNAGIVQDALFLDMSPEAWRRVLRTNLKGTWMMSWIARTFMTTRDPAYIINIGSISGYYGRVGQANYATSKGGIMGMTKLFSNLYRPSIQVNAIAPGLVKTDMVADMPDSQIQDLLDATHLKRMGSVEDVVAAVLFLVLLPSEAMSGATIFLDGGFMK